MGFSTKHAYHLIAETDFNIVTHSRTDDASVSGGVVSSAGIFASVGSVGGTGAMTMSSMLIGRGRLSAFTDSMSATASDMDAVGHSGLASGTVM